MTRKTALTRQLAKKDNTIVRIVAETPIVLRNLVTTGGWLMTHRTLVWIGVTGLLVAGCSNSPSGAVRDTAVSPAASAEHGHSPGQHGGRIVPIGLDDYHAEPVIGRDGVLRVYLLGKDESRVIEVESQTLIAFARLEDAIEAVELELTASPQPGDAEGKTSVFRGILPGELRGKGVVVTVPSLRIHGERFRFGFTLVASAHPAPEMPAAADEKEEQELYRAPGGKYTADDIRRNGTVTASQKFKGIRPIHDAHPKPGDAICPVSRTKANPKFLWYVGGKGYTFCCVPCIDEFLRDAKENPERILEPSDYTQS